MVSLALQGAGRAGGQSVVGAFGLQATGAASGGRERGAEHHTDRSTHPQAELTVNLSGRGHTAPGADDMEAACGEGQRASGAGSEGGGTQAGAPLGGGTLRAPPNPLRHPHRRLTSLRGTPPEK